MDSAGKRRDAVSGKGMITRWLPRLVLGYLTRGISRFGARILTACSETFAGRPNGRWKTNRRGALPLRR